jgi:zinc transporter, ZIP family
MDILLLALLASSATGFMTAIGALPILLKRRPSEALNDTLLGFSAGVMLAASFFSLIVPALDISKAQYGESIMPALIAVVGILLGALAMAVIERAVPHRHFNTGMEGVQPERIRAIWLVVFAMAIHNFPEGLAVGVGFGGPDPATGYPLAIGIGLQNIPEGLAVALGLLAVGYSRSKAFWVSAATGLLEPLGGLVGGIFVQWSGALLPWGLLFSAGAMLFVISHELIPETHRHGHHRRATSGLMVGLVTMMFLDVWLAA